MNHGVAHETVVVGFGLDVKCVAFWLYFFGEVPSKNWWIDHQKKGKLFSGNCGNGISIFFPFFFPEKLWMGYFIYYICICIDILEYVRHISTINSWPITGHRNPKSTEPEVCSTQTGSMITSGGGFSQRFPRPQYQVAGLDSRSDLTRDDSYPLVMSK